MGLSFITEGAIPFGAADPARAIPSFVVGSAVAGGLVGAFGIKIDGSTRWYLCYRIDKRSNSLSYLCYHWSNRCRCSLWSPKKRKTN